MRRSLSGAACAMALLLSGASLTAMAPPAAAQVGVRIGFDFFHNRLAREGRWMHHPVWGDVWRPRIRALGPDWQPYRNGYWQYTDDYGWYWVSDDPFDDVVYHYGRWVYDPQSQWLWVPGYTWAPAWVVWREGDDYTGWMPMPPDEEFISGSGLGFGVNIGPIGINFYDRWYGGRVDPDRFFVFVDNRHLIERDYRRFVLSRDRVKIIIGRTRPVTKFEVVNNHVVNRGIDLRIVERATGRKIAPVSAKAVIKPGAVITTVDEAKQIRVRERTAHPIDAEAVRRGGGAGMAEPGGKGPNDMNAGPNGGTNKPGNNQAETGGTRGGGRGNANAPAGEGNKQRTSEMPKKAKSGGAEDRMSNPSGEPGMTGPGNGGSETPKNETPKKKRPANPEGAMGGGGETNGAEATGASNTGEGQEGNGAPRHRTKPAGNMSGPNSDQGTGSTGSAPPANARRGGGGGMNGPQSGSSAAPTDNGNTQTPPSPKKKRKQPDSSDQSEPAPH